MSETTHHGWTLLPLCPLAASLLLAAPSARFVYLLVCLCCHPKRRCHTVQSTTTAATGRLFDYCEIIHLYKVIRLYDFISTHFSHSGKWLLIQGYKTYHDTIWTTRNQRWWMEGCKQGELVTGTVTSGWIWNDTNVWHMIYMTSYKYMISQQSNWWPGDDVGRLDGVVPAFWVAPWATVDGVVAAFEWCNNAMQQQDAQGDACKLYDFI